MPAILNEAPILLPTAANAQPPRKLWTRMELAAAESIGLDLTRYELIEGDLINKMGKNWPHVSSLVLLQKWLVMVFGAEFVAPEAPVDVAPEDNPTSEPQPDLVVLTQDVTEFVCVKPKPEDIHLVVEISDSTLAFDLGTKAALYARAGIIEYWVLDLQGRSLTVHRAPHAGRYLDVAVYSEAEAVAPLAAPDLKFPVAAAFKA